MPRSRHRPLPASVSLLAVAWAGAALAGCQDFASGTVDPGQCNRSDPTCTTCHGDPERGDPAPPADTAGRTADTEITVGAHQAHLGPSAWHREIACDECHLVPETVSAAGHIDGGPAELTWGSLATAGDASPIWDRSAATCAGVYCHGSTLQAQDGTHPSPTWTLVDGEQSSCGSCHGLPPASPHPQSTDCSACHGEVVDASLAFLAPELHINGRVELGDMGCSGCHGGPDGPAPPRDTSGGTQTSLVTVGAHQAHLSASEWHRTVLCEECHRVPATVDAPGHLDAAPAEVVWGGLASHDGADPAFDRGAATCENVYCHGSTLMAARTGGTVARTPVWTTVDDTWDACGTTCHTNPPGGTHPGSDNCEACHGVVVASYDAANPALTLFEDASRHVDGTVDLGGQACTTCHGNQATGDPAPPRGTAGETATTDPAVGAHQAHLAASGWHRAVQCADCHTLPSTVAHSNGTVDFSWGGPSNADGASSGYDAGTTTCSGTYCHGTTLAGPSGGGVVNRTPDWTAVDGTYAECGTTCHTNPPGGTHPANTQCETCHGAVINAYNVADPAASTWADPSKHVNGIVEQSGYHDLVGWRTPGGGTDHHGSHYFLANQQRDEHGLQCTQCHGANLDGGSSGVSCDNLGCHGRDWRSCDFCHGTYPGQVNPPLGVADESTTGTLAVGRHVAHLSASGTHVAFDCAGCHVIPSAGDVSHALGYQPSADLTTTGHHGDVTLSGRATGMTWNVNATQGTPATARGTCTGACHSNGSGGPPAVTPYWAGGTWNTGSCGSCHPAQPTTGEHAFHRNHGIGCSECHPDADTGTHMDGSKTYTGVVALTPNACQGNTRPRCSGICHGTEHTGDCWP